MKKLICLIFFIFLVACLKNGTEQVRIVDNDGNPVKLNKMVPDFNREQLIKQKEAFNKNQKDIIEVNKFRQDYNETNTQQLNNKNSLDISDKNIIIPINNRYPDDIFADRITNYNYIKEDKNIIQRIKTNDIPKVSNKEKIINNKKNKIIEEDVKKTKTTKQDINNVNKTKNTINDSNIINLDNNIKNTKNKIYVFGNTEKSNKNTLKNNQKSKMVKDKSIEKTIPTIKKENSKTKGYYIQIGIYNKKNNADISYKKYSKINPAIIEEYSIKNKKMYKVLLGPIDNKEKAEEVLEKIIKTGHYDVYIIEKK